VVLVGIHMRCTNSSVVAARIREVMTIVGRDWSAWPSESEWQELLPSWFVDACGPTQTRAEAEDDIKKWRLMSTATQIAYEARVKWSLADWLHWLEPDEREWWWVAEEIHGPNDLTILLRINGWPAPFGAFDWLARVAGAEELDPAKPA
jgi:hypothetical protein